MNPLASNNPYASPKAPESVTQIRRASWRRGVAFAAGWFVSVFLLVLALAVAGAISSFVSTGSEVDLRNDLLRLPASAPGAIILGMVFGGAALANHAPATRCGFLRALLLISAGTLPLAIAVAGVFGVLSRFARNPLLPDSAFFLVILCGAVLVLLAAPPALAVALARRRIAQESAREASSTLP